MAYIFGAPGLPKTPEELSRMRAVAQALALRDTGAPKNIGEGLSAIGNALAYRSMMGDVDKAEAAGKASSAATMGDLIGSIGTGAGAAPVAARPPAGPVIPPEALNPAAMAEAPAPMSGGTLSQGNGTDPHAAAIASIESGGKYDALGPMTKGDRAYGKYQVMGANVPEWTQAALGQSMTPEQFMSNPEAQDAVFKHRFGQYVAKYGPEGAAKAWFAGEGGMNNPNAKDVLGTTVSAYANKFNNALGPQIASNDPNFMPAMMSPEPAMPPQPMQPDPTAMAFNAQPQSGNPLANGVPPPPTPAGMQPFVSPQNLQTVQTRLAQLPIGGQPPQAAPQQPQSAGPSPTVEQLMKAAQNPWLSSGQQAIVKTLLEKKLKEQDQANDPLRQLQIKKAERDLADGKNPESVREYEYAKNNGFAGTFQDWIAGKRAGAGEYGLNAIWGKGPDGNPAIIQLGKGGKPILTPMPEGFQPNKDAQKVDLGTHWGILDPTTRNLVTTIPKDLRGAEREKGIGEQQGKEVAAAPGDIRAGENAVSILDQIKKHEYIDRGTGFTSYGNSVRGTGGYDFENLVQGAKSGAFLQAIQQMRGLGSLSNAEGDAATRAISRMDTATSKEAFLKAVDDYEKIVTQGMTRAKARLANPSATNPTGKPPANTTSSGVTWSVE